MSDSPLPQPETSVPPRATPPKGSRNSLDVRGLLIGVLAAVILVATLIMIPLFLNSGYICSCPPAPSTIGLANTISGYLTSGVPISAEGTWGVGQSCTAVSPCQTDNFSLSTLPSVNTSWFGFKITATTGSTVTGWIMVLWNYQGTAPLAAWSQANSTWTAAHGQTLPIGGLQDDGVMLITAPGTTLIGSGDVLAAFGTGHGSVSGHTNL